MHVQVLISALILQIPPTAELPGPTFQPNMPTYQQGEDPAIRNCSCVQCSALQHTQAGPPTWYHDEQEDTRDFGVSSLCDGDIILQLTKHSPKRAGTPYLDQGQVVGTGAEIDIVVPDHAPPQIETAVSANTLSHIILHA